MHKSHSDSPLTGKSRHQGGEQCWRLVGPKQPNTELAGRGLHGVQSLGHSFGLVGSYQRDSFKAGGSASAMLQPLFDNQVGLKSKQNMEHVPLSLDRAMRLMKEASGRGLSPKEGLIFVLLSLTTSELVNFVSWNY